MTMYASAVLALALGSLGFGLDAFFSPSCSQTTVVAAAAFFAARSLEWSFAFTLSLSKEMVEAKVDVEAMDATSTSLLLTLAGLIFGEAGWKRVGGWSFGKRD